MANNSKLRFLIEEILEKPGNMRTVEEITVLKEKLLPQFKFFAENERLMKDQDLQNSICSSLGFQEYKKGDIIFNIGDYADRMYLLLRGQVNILLPVTQIDLIRPWKLTDEIKFELHKKYPDVETHLGGIHLDELKKPWLIFNSALDLLYKYYSTLTSGNIFGELGLLRKKPRLATILVKEDCSLAYVGKTDYVELLSRTFDYRAERKKIQFFQQYFFSGTLAENSMVKLCYLLEKGHKTSRDLVFSELQKLDNVYLIRSGDVETSKIFYISARESPNKWLSSKEYNELPLIERRFYRTQKIIIGHHSKGEMLGIEDLANTIYSCTVTCLTPTKFYYFNRTVPKLLILPNHKHFIGFVKLGS